MKNTPFHAYMDTNAMQHYQVYVLDMFMFSTCIYAQFVTIKYSVFINNAVA